MQVKCSAPGKVILFGEHAVVYGTTAVAAALSDLRIYVDMDIDSAVSSSSITVELHDIPSDDDDTKPYTEIIDILKLKDTLQLPLSAPFSPVNPDVNMLDRLKCTFVKSNINSGQCISAICYLLGSILPEYVEDALPTKYCMSFKIKSVGLPIGAGLGSSAAFSVALAGALLLTRHMLFRDVPDVDSTTTCATTVYKNIHISPPVSLLPILNKWAYASEVVIHGAPSGLDNATSCFGGVVKYNKDQGKFENISSLPDINILLTNTKIPRSTKLLVAGVRVLHDELPDVIKPILSSIEGISTKFLNILATFASSNDANSEVGSSNNSKLIDEISKLIVINHSLLNAIGVGHPSLDQVCAMAKKYGCSSKLTGAGGGGCAITLLPSNTGNSSDTDVSIVNDKIHSLCRELNGIAFDTFQSKIGGDGVRWHL